MAVNKVVYGGTALIDLTGDTVTSESLLSGFTAHSANGEQITGTATADTNATASDIASGATAYVKGEKITGNVPVIPRNGTNHVEDCPVDTVSGKLRLKVQETTDRLYRSGATIEARTALSNFGNASAADVAKGKTFTSSAGFLVTGTKEDSGGSGDTTLNAEIQTISIVTSPTVTFNGSGGTYEVYGYGKGTTSMYQTPKYAFCGSTYYSISSYGNDTSRTLSITIDANGNISGLPSMTSGNLVIVRKP